MHNHLLTFLKQGTSLPMIPHSTRMSLGKQPSHPWDLCFHPNLVKVAIQVDFEFESFNHPETYHASKKSSLVCHRRKTTSSNSNSSLQLTITH